MSSRSAAVVLHATLLVVAAAPGAARAQALPPALPPVPVPAENPVTEPKRILGKILFWDEQLSSDHSVACGTCHLPEFGGGDPRPGAHPGADGSFGNADDVVGSPGVRRASALNVHTADPVFGTGLQVTGRHAPSFFGALFDVDTFWDGRARSAFADPQTGAPAIASGGALESQAVGPILSDVEMAHEDRSWDGVVAGLRVAVPLAMATDLPPDVAAALASGPSYPALFAAAFGDEAITASRIAFAIATYERTLVPDETPYDRFAAGDVAALTPAQRAGLAFLNGPACGPCHPAPNFSNGTFRNIGLRPPDEDLGRAIVTGLDADRGRFKVPALRNVGLKTHFMHDGRLTSLEQVLDFYQAINGQVHFPENQDPLVAGGIPIAPLTRVQLLDFLRNGLTDPRVANGTAPFDRPTLRGGQGLCDDGLDNDADDAIDLADAQCTDATDNFEGSACGLGFEAAPLLLLLLRARRRRRP